jgi:GTP-binding protein
MGRKKFGKNGESLVIKVPPGTVVIDEESGRAMKDLLNAGDSFVAARGGRGGRGNVNFKSPVRQAPKFAEAGGLPLERAVALELKLIADVGLIGFPNVGKSTLLAAATNASPKIGNYHFTTTTPNLGIVELYDVSFVMADIPGLIEGAHAGQGLGLDFLKHIERTKALIHVVDVSGSEGRDAIEDFRKVNRELGLYTETLLRKPQIVAANKMDVVGEGSEAYRLFREAIEGEGFAVYPVSAAAGTGIGELMNAAAGALAKAERESPPSGIADGGTFDFGPLESMPEYREIRISESGGAYVLDGMQLSKIFDSTNFNDMGSVRHLYKYLEKHGAIETLKGMGMKDGDTIRIRDYELEFCDE